MRRLVGRVPLKARPAKGIGRTVDDKAGVQAIGATAPETQPFPRRPGKILAERDRMHYRSEPKVILFQHVKRSSLV
jgi:hypothetical protein